MVWVRAADDIEILPEAGDSFFMSPSFTGGRPPTTNPPTPSCLTLETDTANTNTNDNDDDNTNANTKATNQPTANF